MGAKGKRERTGKKKHKREESGGERKSS